MRNLQTDGLVQDCSISIANPLEILQSCTKPPKSCTLLLLLIAQLLYNSRNDTKLCSTQKVFLQNLQEHNLMKYYNIKWNRTSPFNVNAWK